MKSKKIKLVLGILLVATFLISLASAYKLLCLTYGESLPNGYTCWHSQCINICTTDNNYPTNPSYCKKMKACEALGGNTTVDGEPPNLTINSPIDGSVYDSRRVLVDFFVDEPSSIYWIDNIMGRGRWKRICSNCLGEKQKYLRFKEGLNDITIKAKDRKDNSVEENFTFRVDSKKPKIKKTWPKRGFASGLFEVEFDEENPKSLVLHYGIYSDMREAEVDLENDCEEGRRNTECSVEVDLSEFDNQKIKYRFVLEDIAENTDESKQEFLEVDNSNPIIISAEYLNDGRKEYIIAEIEESNLEEVVYIDLNDYRAKEKRLCKKLEKGICEGKVRLDDGQHDVKIIARDEAGREDETEIYFFSDSKEPKIKKTWPKRGFASGLFEVEIQEDNPVNLILYYGDKEKEVNLSTCRLIKGRSGKQYCEVEVDVSEFEGEEIEYWFELIDIAESSAESKHVWLNVDTTDPVIVNEEDFWEQGEGRYERYIYFDIEIDEKNFDEVGYTYVSRGKERYKRLCSRLRDGKCVKRKSFSRGTYIKDVQVFDEAGNARSYSVDYLVDY